MSDPWAEINKRWQAWQGLQLPIRKYFLLVANWLLHADSVAEELREDRRRGIDALFQSADGRLSPAQRADVREWADRRTTQLTEGRDREWPVDQLVTYEFLWPGRADKEITVVRQMCSALDDPVAVAQEIFPAWLGYKSPEGILSVMECLNPNGWCPIDGWVPPVTARRWARRVYAKQDFSYLPFLALLLEEAGYSDRILLDHCRKRTTHYRGCAAIDWLIGVASAVRSDDSRRDT